MGKFIQYEEGYKYQLAADYEETVAICPANTILERFFALLPQPDGTGRLVIRAGYAWDGPSGPAIDTKNFMRGSLVHDALYQMLREGLLPESARAQADAELRRICLEDGMSRLRAWWVFRAVRDFAAAAAARQPEPILTAP